MPNYAPESKVKSVAIGLLAVAILLPASLGFGEKIMTFFQFAAKDPAARFAVVPTLNYVILACGFFCLLIWAALNGMFRDIERPKHDMLEREAKLEEMEAQQGSLLKNG